MYQDLFYQIEAIPRVSTIESDLAFFFNSLGKDKQTNKRKMSPTPQSKEANASAHIAILWASEKVFELLQQDKTEEALEIAIKHRIITPVSAAVVLETQAQYEQHNLKQADSSEVHQVSEPQILWLFFCIALFLWLKRRIRLPSHIPLICNK